MPVYASEQVIGAWPAKKVTSNIRKRDQRRYRIVAGGNQFGIYNAFIRVVIHVRTCSQVECRSRLIGSHTSSNRSVSLAPTRRVIAAFHWLAHVEKSQQLIGSHTTSIRNVSLTRTSSIGSVARVACIEEVARILIFTVAYPVKYPRKCLHYIIIAFKAYITFRISHTSRFNVALQRPRTRCTHVELFKNLHHNRQIQSKSKDEANSLHLEVKNSRKHGGFKVTEAKTNNHKGSGNSNQLLMEIHQWQRQR